VVLVVLAVTQSAPWGWTDARVLTALAAGAIVVAAALWRSARHPVPAIEIDLWSSPTYAAANVVSALFGAVLYAWLLLGVLFLVEIWDYTELEAGLALSPAAAAAAAVGVAVGRLGSPPSPRALASLGATAIACTGAALAVWVPAEPHFLTVWIPAGLVAGAGMGAVSVGISAAAALSVAPERFASATGLNVAARQVGGALGVAALAAILAGHTPADGLAPFRAVYVFAAVVCGVAALAALRLALAADTPTVALQSAGSATATAGPER